MSGTSCSSSRARACLEIVDLDRDVIREADRRAGAGIGAAGPARRLALHEEMELVVAHLEPCALEAEVVRPRHFLEPERSAVEASRALEIGDDQPAVLETLRHDSKPNGKELRCR